MKVFISGPMSGKPNYNRAAFFKAEEELEKHGYSVWNPAWLAYPSNTEFSKDAIHAIDNEALRHCDAIYMLKGWMHSEGAWNEHEIAEARELVIMYEGKCCWDNEPEDEHDVLKKHIKTVEEALAWERWKNRLTDEVEAIKESIGTDNLQEQLEKDFADVYEEFQNTKDQVNDINMGYIKWSSEVSQFNERIEKLEENMKEIVANGGLGLSFNLMNERVSSNKRDSSSLRNDIDVIHSWINIHDRADEALERRIKALEKKSDELNHAVGIQGKEIGSIIQRRCDDNQVVNNMLNDINIRLNGIEKRLNIKPSYAPTEDEKDD